MDGVIPYAAEPQVYDPPGHVVATANQRPVGPSYPYYIGTSADFFDNSFRANEIYSYLRGHSAMTPASFADLQGSVTDSLAATIVPRLLAALRQAPGSLTGPERTAMNLLAGWNDTMTTGSAAASVWWTFWGDYISATFQPWWTSAHVPVGKDRAALALSSWPTSLTEDLTAWTAGPAPPAAASPGPASPGPGSCGSRRALHPAVGCAPHRRPGDAGGVRHGRRAPGREARRDAGRLDVGAAAHPVLPVPERGRRPGLRAARVQRRRLDGGRGRRRPAVQHRPELADDRGLLRARRVSPVTAEGVYPGGQSENPASPWYANLIADWWDDRYLPMAAASSAGSHPLVPAARCRAAGGRPWLT